MTSSRQEIRLPDLGEIEQVTVAAWLCRLGDTVAEGEDLVEVETEKTTFVIPAPITGRLIRIDAEAGDPVPAGGILGELEPCAA